jgi:hypothetical protein
VANEDSFAVERLRAAGFDHAYRFFWVSDRFSRHSENIRNNPNAFLAVYDSTIPEGTGAGQGVYIQARVIELTDPEHIERAHRVMAARSGRTPRPAQDYLGDMPGRIYQAARNGSGSTTWANATAWGSTPATKWIWLHSAPKRADHRQNACGGCGVGDVVIKERLVPTFKLGLYGLAPGRVSR